MRLLFLGKRHYTNQDALLQRFGRIFRLPLSWHRSGQTMLLVVVDYYGHRREAVTDDGLTAQSLPIRAPRSLPHLLATAKGFQPDIIIASGDCLIGLLGRWLARRTRAKFIFDVYDDYRTLSAYKLFLGWDAFGLLCRRANLVMYASRAMAERHEYGGLSVVVPNGVDVNEFAPSPMLEARARLELPEGGRLVGYFGSMLPEHGVGVLIRALEKLRSRRPDLRLLLCGRQHAATPISGDGVLYHGMVPHRSIPTYMNACDVLALPYLHGAFLDSASSCKIAEYLFCRRPIVASRTPNFVQNFPDQAKRLDALLVPPGDADALADAIERQLDDPVIAEPPADMSWQDIAERLIPHFQRLLA